MNSRYKYVVTGMILVLAFLGYVIVRSMGRDDLMTDGGLGNDIMTDNRRKAVSVVKHVSSGKDIGSKKRLDRKGKVRHPVKLVIDTEDRDDLSPEDKRLLAAIEKGVDEDSLEQIVQILPEASSSTNIEVRSDLVDALGWFGVPAMDHLLPLMADPDEDVRQTAIDNWTSSLGDIADERAKAELISAVMQILNDEDALESMTMELTDMDEKIALQVLVDVIEGGKADKKAVAAAREQYEFLTGDEYTTINAANQWLIENYESPEQEAISKGNEL